MSELQLYSTLSRQLEPITKQEDGSVGIYCCGPTVYDVPHAGHARSALAPDVLVRFLRARGERVVYVRNVTDVDDKIIDRAKQNGEPPLELSARMARVYIEQIGAVGCLAPDHQPHVSAHIPQIVALVEELVASGSAYTVERPNGTRDVYFIVRNFQGYGKLSRRRIDELEVGARVAEDELKHDPLDFALWKGATEGELGWDSPWGRGRPGWHIECSAMSRHYLGHGFSIHAGGMDLIFPHHENEIAQSEAACPAAGNFAKVWIHNGFVNVDKEKMSKSLGNFVTVQDVLNRNDPEAFRWFLLTVHYRGPIQFETEKLESGRVVFPGVDEAEKRVDYVYQSVERLKTLAEVTNAADPVKLPPEIVTTRKAAQTARDQAEQGMLEDLNTPIALASLGELARLGNDTCDLAQKRKKDAAFIAAAAATARELLTRIGEIVGWLGLLQADYTTYQTRTKTRRAASRGLQLSDIEAWIADRALARQNKDFARSDQIRDDLLKLGVAVKDSPEGQIWSLEV
jgi:cysteinyl-tRNA synthetase